MMPVTLNFVYLYIIQPLTLPRWYGGVLQERVDKRNVSFSRKEVNKNWSSKDIIPQEWKSRVDSLVRRQRGKYIEMEPQIGKVSDQIMVNFGEDSASEFRWLW